MLRPQKVLLFEWLTSGGLWREGVTPSRECSMQKQGRDMLLALVEDFLAGGLEVVLPVDGRLVAGISDRANLSKIAIGESDNLQVELFELASQSDYVMVVAPETEHTLSNCLEWLNDFDDKTINPNIAFTNLTSNKQLTFDHLQSHGFSHMPRGVNFGQFQNDVEAIRRISFPAVLKPVDGAGSEEVTVVENWSGWQSNLARPPECYRLESFVAGTPVSVSVIGAADHCELLSPTIQLFDQSRRSQGLIGEYIGAEFPIDETISQRALDLASKVVQSLPPTAGYFGMDLVIGDLDGQPNDCFIEINPRLTSSYLKLREIYKENLAMLILESARSAPARNVSSIKRCCTFRAPCP